MTSRILIVIIALASFARSNGAFKTFDRLGPYVNGNKPLPLLDQIDQVETKKQLQKFLPALEEIDRLFKNLPIPNSFLEEVCFGKCSGYTLKREDASTTCSTFLLFIDLQNWPPLPTESDSVESVNYFTFLKYASDYVCWIEEMGWINETTGKLLNDNIETDLKMTQFYNLTSSSAANCENFEAHIPGVLDNFNSTGNITELNQALFKYANASMSGDHDHDVDNPVLDVLDLDDPYNAAKFLVEFNAIIRCIQATIDRDCKDYIRNVNSRVNVNTPSFPGGKFKFLSV